MPINTWGPAAQVVRYTYLRSQVADAAEEDPTKVRVEGDTFVVTNPIQLNSFTGTATTILPGTTIHKEPTAGDQICMEYLEDGRMEYAVGPHRNKVTETITQSSQGGLFRAKRDLLTTTTENIEPAFLDHKDFKRMNQCFLRVTETSVSDLAKGVLVSHDKKVEMGENGSFYIAR